MGASCTKPAAVAAVVGHHARIENKSDTAVDLWFDGGGPIERGIPAGSMMIIPMPRHVHDHPKVKWSVTTSDSLGMPVASGSFDNPMCNHAPSPVVCIPELSCAVNPTVY